MRKRILHAAASTSVALMLAASAAFASSHSEAPGTAKDRLIDDTDVWAFVAPDAPDAVTFIGAWVPMLEPNGGPNFYQFDDEAHYYINVDNVGDAREHIRFEFTFKNVRANGNTFLYNTGVVRNFNDPTLNVRQTWSLTRNDNGVEAVMATDRPVAPNFVGPKSMPDYGALAQSTITTLSDGTRIFVGPRDDPFFVDLGAIFDLLTIRKLPGNMGRGVDGLGGFDVMVIAMQVPKTRLTRDGMPPNAQNSVIGIYDDAERLATRTINADGTISLSGDEMMVSRLGQPLVNEVIIPLKDKDKFNHTRPTGDGAFLPYVVDPELPKLFNALYGLPIPTTPRNDLVTVFLTGIPGLNQPNNPNQVPCEMLRLNIAIPPTLKPNRLGVIAGDNAGFPNGRRLFDDVVDIEERAAAGGYVLTPSFNHAPANELGDGVDFNDRPFLPYFPYAAPPHNPFHHHHHPLQRGKGHGADDAEDDSNDDSLEPSSGDNASLQPGPSVESLKLGFAGANPATASRLQYSLERPGRVQLRVYDVAGRNIRTLIDQDAAAGTFRSSWDGRKEDGSLAVKGIYFVRFSVDGRAADTRKIVLE